jgi:hypothetical protein
MDVVFLGTIVVFFALAVAVVCGCEALEKRR